MKANFKHKPTYYVIVKDVQIVDKNDKPVIGSGPIEVTTNRDLAIDHTFALNRIKGKLADLVKSDNPEKIKEVNIEFRMCELDEQANETVQNLLAANEEDENDEKNESGEPESDHV